MSEVLALLFGVPATSKSSLRALRNWISGQHRDGIPVDIGNFTLEISRGRIITAGCSTSTTDSGSLTAKSGPAPKEWGGHHDTWVKTKKQIQTYLGSMVGSKRFPVTHILLKRDGDIPDSPALLVRMYSTPLQGSEYDNDNYRVYHELARITLHGNARLYVESFPNVGQEASFNLLATFESPMTITQQINRADRIITNTKFVQEDRRFKFKDFIAKYNDAFQIIDEYNPDRYDEKTKIMKFVTNMSHLQLSPIAATVMSKPGEQKFTVAAAEIVSLAVMMNVLTNSKDSKISKVNTMGRAGRGGRGGQSGGKYGGRGEEVVEFEVMGDAEMEDVTAKTQMETMMTDSILLIIF